MSILENTCRSWTDILSSSYRGIRYRMAAAQSLLAKPVRHLQNTPQRVTRSAWPQGNEPITGWIQQGLPVCHRFDLSHFPLLEMAANHGARTT